MKKGFSLIEILAAAAVMLIAASISIYGIAEYNNTKNDIDINMTESSILAVINYGKQYCREREKPGFVMFDVAKGEVGFYFQNKEVEGFKLSSNISINSVNTGSSKVEIDKYGVTSDAGTIILKDKNNKLYTITINVGAGYAEIK